MKRTKGVKNPFMPIKIPKEYFYEKWCISDNVLKYWHNIKLPDGMLGHFLYKYYYIE